jgi:hypothetical protein
VEKKYKARERLAKVEPALEEQFQASRVLGEWVCVSPVPGPCRSWLWSWRYDTVHPLYYDSVGISRSGVMVPCPLSHSHVDFSCGSRGLVLCSLVDSFHHFRGTCYAYLEGKLQMNVAGSSEVVTTFWSVQCDSWKHHISKPVNFFIQFGSVFVFLLIQVYWHWIML